jgi:L-rhamnose mutarotase
MNRYVLTVDLRDDRAAIERYRQHHAEVWPEVVRSFRAAGVRDLDLYLLDRRLVMILDLDDGLALDEVLARHRASHPRVAEWEALMKTFQQPPPGAPPGETWALMEPVFALAARTTAAGPVVTP